MNPNRKIAFVHQKGNNDCGLAALEMISRYYELPYSLQVNTHNKGISLAEMKQYAQLLGLCAYAYKVSEDGFNNITLPAILLLQQKHYVVACEQKLGHVLIADPLIGFIKYELKTLMQQWLIHNDNYGIAIELYQPNYEGYFY